MPLIIMTHTRYYQSKQLRILHTSCEFVVIVKKLSKQIVPNLKYCGYWSLYILIKRVLYDENLKKMTKKLKKDTSLLWTFWCYRCGRLARYFFAIDTCSQTTWLRPLRNEKRNLAFIFCYHAIATSCSSLQLAVLYWLQLWYLCWFLFPRILSIQSISK